MRGRASDGGRGSGGLAFGPQAPRFEKVCGDGGLRRVRPGPHFPAVSPACALGWQQARWQPAGARASPTLTLWRWLVTMFCLSRAPLPPPLLAAPQTIDSKLGEVVFDKDKVAEWTAKISEECLQGCRAIEKPFKFVGVCPPPPVPPVPLPTAPQCAMML